MKKTLLAIAAMVAVGGAMACQGGACVVAPTSKATVTGNATSSVQTGAYAGSSGNGASFSYNAAGSKATSEGFSTVGANGAGIGKPGWGGGGAAVGGTATTSGYLLSTSGSVGNAAASGFAVGEACADVTAFGSYKAFQVDGQADGRANSYTGGGVSTAAGPGAGLAVAGGAGGNVSGFVATAGSGYVGTLTGGRLNPKLNIATETEGSAGANSVSLGAIGNNHVGNADSSSGGANFGNAWANSKANAGNCENGCFNYKQPQ